MPNHVHLVVLRHERNAENIIGHLKARATQALVEVGLHPFEQHRGADGRFPSVWARRGWKVYLDSAEDIIRAVKYVESNPEKDGLPKQRWSFVQSYPLATPRKRGR
jgi:REP element-mobilizing transposase RayT